MFSIRPARAEVLDIPHPAKHRRLKRRLPGRGAGLVHRPQASCAARFSVVPVTVLFSAVLNARLVLRALSFLKKWPSWPSGIGELIRESWDTLAQIDLFGDLSAHPCWEQRKKRSPPFSVWCSLTFSFAVTTSECKLDSFFSWMFVCGGLFGFPLLKEKKKKEIAERLASVCPTALVPWFQSPGLGFLSHHPHDSFICC